MRIQKLTKALIIIHCLLFLIACSEYSDPVQTYSVDIQQRDSVSCFFTSYSYIPLETNENCMLGEVVGMKVNEDAIAIEDQGRILLFQHDGKFISKIDKAGRGAGEYLSIEDFCVKDSTVYVLSRPQKIILAYSWSGTFKQGIELNDWYQHFQILDDEWMFLASENANDTGANFVLFNYVTREYGDAFSPFEKNESVTFSSFSPFAGTFSGGLYVVHPFDYTIYQLGKSLFEPYCRFEFNTKKQIKKGETWMRLSDQTSNENVVRYLDLYKEYNGSKYMTFDLFEEDYGYGAYIDKIEPDGTHRLMRIYETFPADFPYLSAPWGIYKDAFYSIRPAFDILNIEGAYRLTLFHEKGLTKESNHVVFFHKLK